MADSYIYTLVEASTLSATDYTVVDTYVDSLSGYITKKSNLYTIAVTISSSIVDPLTSWLPIDSWNQAYSTTTSYSTEWVLSFNTLTANSGTWGDVYTVVAAGSSNWSSSGNTFTTLSQNSAYWKNTHDVVSTLSASWILSGGSTTIPSLSDMFNSMPISALSTPATATGDFMLVTIGDQRRAIKLWTY